MTHGTRRSYVAGCLCTRCRASNAAYVPTPRVDSTPARTHLQHLVALGVGTRHLSTQTGVSRRTILHVLHGTAPTIQARTSARLLTARPTLAHGSLVAGTRTWRFIDSLHREGFTRRELAFHLGRHSQQLQLAHRVTVRSALAVQSLYTHLAT